MTKVTEVLERFGQNSALWTFFRGVHSQYYVPYVDDWVGV